MTYENSHSGSYHSKVYFKNLFDFPEREIRSIALNLASKHVVRELLLPYDWIYYELKYTKGPLRLSVEKTRLMVIRFAEYGVDKYDPWIYKGGVKTMEADIVRVVDVDNDGIKFSRAKFYRSKRWIYSLKNSYSKLGISVWVKNWYDRKSPTDSRYDRKSARTTLVFSLL